VKAAFAFVHYNGQAGVIAHPDLVSDFRYRLVEKRHDGAQGARGHPDIRLLLADVDMPNDVLMFRKSGFSIAMGNSSDEVKAQASAVTDSNENEGFAKAVRKFVLPPAAP
jgi:haloacid dehalogenase-like hydrolase